MKAAIQGVHGAYSDLACKQLLGEKCSTIPYESFEAVFDAVVNDEVDIALVPIENSLAGSIHQNYDLLLSRDVNIVAETRLKVEHVLMCHPSTSLKNISEVRSHPQALAQCSKFFSEEKKIKAVVYFDTAGAAKSLVQESPKNIGAIASSYAAELYQLKILRKHLQNQPNNFTRFLAIEKKSLENKKKSLGNKKTPLRNKKTSIAFMPNKNEVGILFRMLGAFAFRDIDLLKIESRPNPSSPFEYWFYVDFAGSIGDAKVDRALDQLREVAVELKILGSYPKFKS